MGPGGLVSENALHNGVGGAGLGWVPPGAFGPSPTPTPPPWLDFGGVGLLHFWPVGAVEVY